MTHWNHRVLKKTYDSDEELYGIVEVFYNEDGSIYARTDFIEVTCESVDSLARTLEWMVSCLDKPVLVDGEIEFAEMDRQLEEIEEFERILETEGEERAEQWMDEHGWVTLDKLWGDNDVPGRN